MRNKVAKNIKFRSGRRAYVRSGAARSTSLDVPMQSPKLKQSKRQLRIGGEKAKDRRKAAFLTIMARTAGNLYAKGLWGRRLNSFLNSRL